MFYIRASYWLPSLSFHENRASNSLDTISPWKFKVKGTPVSAASSWLIFLVFHINSSYRLSSLSFHGNRASLSRDTIWPWKFKVETIARWDEKHLSFGIRCTLIYRFDGNFLILMRCTTSKICILFFFYENILAMELEFIYTIVWLAIRYSNYVVYSYLLDEKYNLKSVACFD